MLSETMEKALNDQINAELHSAYIYYAMSAYFERNALKGLAHWMRIQALEEMSHAQKFYNYIAERGGSVVLQPIAEVPAEWKSVMEVFEATLDHERYITKRINDLVELSLKEKDHATNIFLHWYVTEQVEEEDHAQEMIDRLKLIGYGRSEELPKGGGLYMLDREMGQRTFTPLEDAAY
ncbi:MAG: ferritin [Bradymonadales bacterium]|nr:ferritin [Bradymonadales bacterium]